MTKEEENAWEGFMTAASTLVDVIHRQDGMNALVRNDIDHAAVDVRNALDDTWPAWRKSLKSKRPEAHVLEN